MSHFFLFPKLRLLVVAGLLVLPLNLLAASDSSADQEDGDDDPDGLCAEVILESIGSIKDVIIKKYGDLCTEDAKNGKIKKNEKGKHIDTENCKKLKCFEDKSLKFKFKSSGESSSSSADGNGFEKEIKAQNEKPQSAQEEGKMTLSRCVDEDVDTSVPYSQMSSVQK